MEKRKHDSMGELPQSLSHNVRLFVLYIIYTNNVCSCNTIVDFLRCFVLLKTNHILQIIDLVTTGGERVSNCILVD